LSKGSFIWDEGSGVQELLPVIVVVAVVIVVVVVVVAVEEEEEEGDGGGWYIGVIDSRQANTYKDPHSKILPLSSSSSSSSS